MKKLIIYTFIPLFINILSANISFAESIKAENRPLAWSDVDFSTPRSPAAKIIGEVDQAGSISSPDELAIQLLTGLDSDGKFQPGIAIDFVPYLLIKGTNFTLAEYRNDGFQQFLARTKFSVATSKSDTNARLGSGAEFILIDQGDPRLDTPLLGEINSILDKQPPPIKQDLRETPENFDKRQKRYFKAYDDSLKPLIEDAKNQARDRLTQQPIWNVGFGSSLVSTSGKYFDLRSDGMGIWSTYKTGLGGKSEIRLQSNYRSGERISDRKGAFFNGNTVTLAAQVRTGDEDFKFSFETAFNIENQSGKESNTYLNFGIGVEPKLNKDLWLSFSINGATGRQNGDDVRIFSGLKWNFNDGKQ
jgi:hypothetical protein